MSVAHAELKLICCIWRLLLVEGWISVYKGNKVQFKGTFDDDANFYTCYYYN
jgi:hypothetical protein